MKKFLTLCAVCAMLFACGGNSNPGIDYLEKAKEAANKGNVELAEEYMDKFEQWAEGLSYEEIAEVEESIDSWFAENDIYDQLYELQTEVVDVNEVVEVDDFVEKYDSVEVYDYVEVTEELSNNVQEMLEEVDVNDALEATGNILQTVSEVSDAIESVENILSIFQ